MYFCINSIKMKNPIIGKFYKISISPVPLGRTGDPNSMPLPEDAIGEWMGNGFRIAGCSALIPLAHIHIEWMEEILPV